MRKILIFFCLIIVFYLNAQQSPTFSMRPTFYKGMTFQQLKWNKQILDVVPELYKQYDDLSPEILFFKIKTDEGELEFFRVDEKTFYTREKIGNNFVNMGSYKYNYEFRITN